MASVPIVGGAVAAGGRFDHHKPAYRCCCGSCHVADGGKILCVVEAVFAAVGLAMVMLQTMAGPATAFGTATNGLGQLIAFAFAMLGYYGIRKWRPNWLLACLLYHAIELCIVAVAVLLAAVWFFALDGQHWFDEYVRHELEIRYRAQGVAPDEEAVRATVVMTELVLLLCLWLVLLVQAWFFSIVLAAYKYVRDACTAGAQVHTRAAYMSAPPARTLMPGQVYVANAGGPQMLVNAEMQAFGYDEKPPAYEVEDAAATVDKEEGPKKDAGE